VSEVTHHIPPWARSWACLVCTALLAAAQAGIEPRQLILRTAEVYQRAANGSIFAAQIHEFGQSAEFKSTRERSRRVIRSGDRMRLEHRAGRRPNGSLWNLAQGRAILYIQEHRHYFETEADSTSGKRVRRQIEHWYRILGGRFAMLGLIEAEFRLLKLEDVKTAGKRIRCAVLSVVPNDRSLGWTQRLWIDPETALVWKSVMQLPPGRDEISALIATEETLIWDEIHIGPVPDEAFAFTPPPGFRVLEIVPNLFWSVPP